METCPKMPMLAFDLKTCNYDSSDFGEKILNYIYAHYQEDPESYQKEIGEFFTLRENAINSSRDFMGLNLIKKYYKQLQYVSNRFPMRSGEECESEFSWDHLYSSKEIVHTDVRFEIESILYNIAAMHSYLGCVDKRTTDEGIKISCTHFQYAAWALQLVRDQYASLDFTNDMHEDILTFKMNLMLAQAQECVLEKSIIDNRKATINAKVSAQVIDYYKVALANCEKAEFQNIVGSRKSKDFKQYVQFKMSYYAALTYYYSCVSSLEQKKIGEAVAYVQAAETKINECVKMKYLKEFQETLKFAQECIDAKVKAVKKENDFVYNEKVPSFESLPEVKGVSLVKCLPIDFENDPEVACQDIFNRLVSMKAHQLSSLYSEEKAKKLRQINSQVDEKNAQLEQFLAALQINQLHLEDFDYLKLPRPLLECCASVNVRQSLLKQEIPQVMKNIVSVSSQAKDILDDIVDLFETEYNEHKGEKATGAQNESDDSDSSSSSEDDEDSRQKSTDKNERKIILKKLINRYETLNKSFTDANASNAQLRLAFDAVVQNLQILSLPLNELSEKLPKIEPINNDESKSVRDKLTSLLAKVDEMKTQRSQLLIRIQRCIQDDDLTQTIASRQNEITNADEFFKEQLKKHEQLISYLQQNLQAQENILKALAEANASFAFDRRKILEATHERDQFIETLIGSYQSVNELFEKANKGVTFFQNLYEPLKKLLKDVKDFYETQKKQRESRKKSISVAGAGAVPTPVLPTTQFRPPKPANFQSNKLDPQLYTPGLQFDVNGQLPVDLELSAGEINKLMNSMGPNVTGDRPKLKDFLPYMKPNSWGANKTKPGPPTVDRSAFGAAQAPQFVDYNQAPSQYQMNNPVDVPRMQAQHHIPSHIMPQQPQHIMPQQPQQPQQQQFNPNMAQMNQFNNQAYLEQQKLIEQQQSQKLMEQQRLLEQQRLMEQQRLIEQQKLAEQQKLYEQKFFEQQRLMEQQKLIEQQRLIEHQKMLENQKIMEQQMLLEQEKRRKQQELEQKLLEQQMKEKELEQKRKQLEEQEEKLRLQQQQFQLQQQQQQNQQYQQQQQQQYQQYQQQQQQPPIIHNVSSIPNNIMQQQIIPPSNANGAFQPSLPSMMMAQAQPAADVKVEKPKIDDLALELESLKMDSIYKPGFFSQLKLPNAKSTVENGAKQTPIPQLPQLPQLPQQQQQMHEQAPYNGIQNGNHAPFSPISSYNNQTNVPSNVPMVPLQPSVMASPVPMANYNPMAQPAVNTPPVGPINKITPAPTPILTPNNYSIKQTNGNDQSKSTNQTATSNVQNVNNTRAPSALDDLFDIFDNSAASKPIQNNFTILEPLKAQPVVTASRIEAQQPQANIQQQQQQSQQQISAIEQNVPKTPVDLVDSLKLPLVSSLPVVDRQTVVEKLLSDYYKLETHVNSLSNKTLSTSITILEKEWKELNDYQDKHSATMTISVARCYPSKNRFNDLLPYDQTRLVIQAKKADDYINGTVLGKIGNEFDNGFLRQPNFLIAQLPLQNDLNDYWLMIHQQQVELVVCLCRENEFGVNAQNGRVNYYWPEDKQAPLVLKNVRVELLSVKQTSYSNQRVLSVTNLVDNVSRTVVLLHYSFSASNNGVQKPTVTNMTGIGVNEMPENINSFMKFIKECEHYHLAQQRNAEQPILVNCVNSVSRSAVFILTYSMIRLIDSSLNNHNINSPQLANIHISSELLLKLIKQMRSKRKYMIQSAHHLKYSYDLLLAYMRDTLVKEGVITQSLQDTHSPPSINVDRKPVVHDVTLISGLDADKFNLDLLNADSEAKRRAKITKKDFLNSPEKAPESKQTDKTDPFGWLNPLQK